VEEKMDNIEENQYDGEREKTLVDAGFTVEQHGSVKIYRRPVSDDVIETSMFFAKRTIGYRSKDIPPKMK
jgi:hypothetical protein